MFIQYYVNFDLIKRCSLRQSQLQWLCWSLYSKKKWDNTRIQDSTRKRQHRSTGTSSSLPCSELFDLQSCWWMWNYIVSELWVGNATTQLQNLYKHFCKCRGKIIFGNLIIYGRRGCSSKCTRSWKNVRWIFIKCWENHGTCSSTLLLIVW